MDFKSENTIKDITQPSINPQLRANKKEESRKGRERIKFDDSDKSRGLEPSPIRNVEIKYTTNEEKKKICNS